MIKKWDLVDSTVEKDYRVFRIRVDRALSPRTKNVGEFYTIESRNWVNVIALTPENQVVMIRQYRHGARTVSIEIPGGLVDEADAREAAFRELMEETGYKGTDAVLLGSTNPNPAIFNNTCFTYLVPNASKAADASLEQDEDIEVDLVPLSAIPGLIAGGTIDHALVIVAFHFYFQKHPLPAAAHGPR